MDVISAKILPGYRSDHSQIARQFDFGKFEKHWKFNNSLLKDTLCLIYRCGSLV